MKTRLCFVSNSSSSSFICDITGAVESGMDISLTDLEMVECVNGHTFCYSVGGFPEVAKWAESDEDCEDYSEDERNTDYGYGLPERLCPICQKEPKAMKTIAMRIKQEMKNLGITSKDVE